LRIVRKVAANLLLAAVLAAVVGSALWVFNRAAAPQERVLPPDVKNRPDYSSILSGINEDGILEDLNALCSTPSRMCGSEGLERAAMHISSALRSAGYQVLEQPFRVVVPRTRWVGIADAEGGELRGISIYPMDPNWFRTATTPPGGLRGVVHKGSLGLAREFKDVNLDGNFVMLPIGESWSTVAGMGASAILFYDDGRPTVAARWGSSVNASLNVPRFMVTGPAESLAGREVVISCRVDFVEARVSNIAAFLDAPGADEAVVLSAYYDAESYVPDLAPGAEQAGGAAVLLAAARAMAAEKAPCRRTVVILATAGHARALAGARQFMRAVGAKEQRARAVSEAEAELAQTVRDIDRLRDALKVASDPAYWLARDREAESAYWSGRGEDVRRVFVKCLRDTIDQDFMDAVERQTLARVDWVRDGMPIRDAEGREVRSFSAYTEARQAQQKIQAIISSPPEALKTRWAGYVADSRLSERLCRLIEARLAELETRAGESRARLDLAKKLAPYRRILFLGLDLSSRSGRIALVCGDENRASTSMPADSEIIARMEEAERSLDALSDEKIYELTGTEIKSPRLRNLVRLADCKNLAFVGSWYGAPLYFDSSAAFWAGHTAFTVVTDGDGRVRAGTPFDTLDRLVNIQANESLPEGETPLGNLAVAARIIAGTACELALGRGRIVPTSLRSSIYSIRGQVVSQVGDSLTPDHPMPGALVRVRSDHLEQTPRGMGSEILVAADFDGHFSIPFVWPNALSMDWENPVTLDAAVCRPENGEITWTLSSPRSGPLAPYSVTGIPIARMSRLLAMPVVFRCASIQLIPMKDPATMNPYKAVDFVEKRTMAAPSEFKVETAGGSYVCYVPPESRLFFTFKKGKRSMPNLMEISAFALNAEGPADGSELAVREEIVGRAYLAADNPRIADIEMDAARSMAQVNSRRIRIQQRYNMADEMVVSYNRKAVELADDAQKDYSRGAKVEAKRKAYDSIAYSSNIHPVIRQNTSDAIAGILFYLFLAIPFAIFAEKLLLGHPDLRVQLAVQGVIFLVFFLALKFTHPAYQLVRSSYMILLGFVTFVLACMVTVFLSSRFSSGMAEINKRLQERAEVADVSRASAAATAFVLGLNHLRKRPVRTGLTVGTLVLTTFVMLCFASVATDLKDIEFALGRALYNGLLIRDRNLQDVSQALPMLRELYGEKHTVAARRWGGNFSYRQGITPSHAAYEIIRDVGGQKNRAEANAFLGLSVAEPEITGVTNAFTLMTRWFQDDKEFSCFLPKYLADYLKLDESEIRSGEAKVTIGSREYAVLGIFDPVRLASLADLDGNSLLPVDIMTVRRHIEQIQTEAATEDVSDIPEDIPRLDGRQVVITPVEAMPAVSLTASVAVRFSRDADYAESRRLITEHLERTAEPAYYGLDGVAYYGGKFRRWSVDGMMDILLPIVIAALTVLNTMRGSVYERRGELYVFNAVGLSPTHIRALFLAEASVYAVVGAVGGYLLAQGVGALARAGGATGGISFNYSSLSSVVVSGVIMAVVFCSSVFPARMAARLAAPAEIMTRKKQTASGDVMEFDLPFTFNKRDRIAIVPYFVDWFDSYGEGSAGEFYCSPPKAFVRMEKDGSAAPVVETVTWLKPYDLGVSQRVEVVVRHLADTGDNVATISMTRKSGDKDSWERCCHAFIGLVRKRFLTWRAIPESERLRLLERGRKMLSGGSGVSAS